MSLNITYQVQVGWSGEPATGVFKIGSSQIGMSDILGFEFEPGLPGFGGPYDDVTSECLRFTASRGADDNLSGVLAGTLEFTLFDKGSGKYNPLNSASPLYGKILPMRPVRVLGLVQSASSIVAYLDIFNGFLREGTDNPDYGENEATFQAVDLLVWIDRIKPVIASTGQTTVGAAINLILDYLPWPSNRRSIAVGSTIPDFSADGSSSGTELISKLLEADRGKFFISKAGIPTYLARNYRDAATSVGTIDVALSQLPGVDLAQIQNQVSVAATYPGGSRTGTPQVAQDAQSIHDYGVADIGNIESLYLMSDQDALYLAKFLIEREKIPTTPIWAVSTVENASELYDPVAFASFLLRVELQQLITISLLGETHNYHVEKMIHTGENGKLHQTQFGCTRKSDVGAFIIGQSTIAGSDILVY